MISRREWLALVGKLGVIGAAAAVGIGSPAHAISRVSVSLNPLFPHAGSRLRDSNLADPRLVENVMYGFALGNYGYDRYYRGAASSWLDFPSNTPTITWGHNVDEAQWLQCATTAGVIEQSYAYVSYVCRGGNTYLFSVTVDSRTGTHTNGNISISGGTWDPGATLTVTNPDPGRYVVGGYCRSGGNIQFRIGVGTTAANPNNATMRFSNAMLERVPKGQTYPGEYVRPGDQHVFAYSRSGTVTTGLVSEPTLGPVHEVPRRSSVLVLGDSWCNDHPTATPNHGDFPFQARRFLAGRNIAINAFGLSGGRIDQITAQIDQAIMRASPTAVPYRMCVAYGGGNDMAQGRTFEQLKDSRLLQLEAIRYANMYPVLVTIPTKNDATVGQRAVRAAYNEWLPTLGYPVYDVYADADNGSGDFKYYWGAADGVHPSNTYTGGASIAGKRLADLIMLVGG